MALLDRYTRLVFAGEYSRLRWRITGSKWWRARYRKLERERKWMLTEEDE